MGCNQNSNSYNHFGICSIKINESTNHEPKGAGVGGESKKEIFIDSMENKDNDICPKCGSIIRDMDGLCWKCLTETNK